MLEFNYAKIFLHPYNSLSFYKHHIENIMSEYKKKFMLLIKSRIHYFLYVFMVDKAFASGLGLAILSFSETLILLPSGNWNFLEQIGFFPSLFFGLGSLIDAFKKIGIYHPKSSKKEYIIYDKKELIDKEETNGKITREEVNFRDLLPSYEYKKNGFIDIDPQLGAGEKAHTSKNLNDWLLTQPKIKLVLGESKVNSVILQDEEEKDKKINQLKFLYAMVYNKSALNEKKYRIDDIFIKPVDEIKINKIGYYDALVTNQAFRCVLRERSKGSNQLGEQIENMRKWFPFHKEDIKYCLRPSGSNSIADSVGISTLVISSDGHPIIFYQSVGSIQNSAKLTVMGSGSADFSDIALAKNNNFLDVVKYGMAREACEEGSIVYHKDHKKIFNEAIKNTLVIGFFRWVSRSGKPEFIGVTRINLKFDDIKADGTEVISLEKTPESQFTTIKKVTDFKSLYDGLQKTNGIGLSSAMVIWRLKQIAEATTDEDKELRQFLADFLKIPVSHDESHKA